MLVRLGQEVQALPRRVASLRPPQRGPGARGLVVLLVAASLVFAALALDVTHRGALARLDVRAARWIASEMPGWVDEIARQVTRLGGLAPLSALVALGAAWLLRARRHRDAALLVLALGCAELATAGLKVAFERPRPDEGSAIPLPQSSSFPSGHAASSVAVLVLLALLAAGPPEAACAALGRRRRERSAVAAAALLAVAIGASRVVLNVHFVSDVLAGFCVGLAVLAGCLLARLYRSPAPASAGA